MLELKVVADVGLVGFPSAGKSSLIAAISRARPKIADYPFTTLVPNLGVVTAGDTTFTVADVPGLIEGASEGRGLGHDFLRHIERCAALVHVIDTATMEPGRNPVDDLDVIESELARYGGLEDRPRLVALNKIDVPDGRDIADIVARTCASAASRSSRGRAASGAGLRELTFAMAEIVVAARAAKPAAEPERIVLRPPGGRRRRDFTVTETDEGWRVRGDKPERWVRQTDFSNDEAVGFLADRLNRLGVEARLAPAGRRGGRRGPDRRPPTTPWSSTSSPASTPARRCSAAAARTTLRRGPPGRAPPPRDRRSDARPAESETRADIARRLDQSRRRRTQPPRAAPTWARSPTRSAPMTTPPRRH